MVKNGRHRTASLPARRCSLKPNVPRPLGSRGVTPCRRRHPGEEPWSHNGCPLCGTSVEDSLQPHRWLCNPRVGDPGRVLARRPRRTLHSARTSLDGLPPAAQGAENNTGPAHLHQGAPGPGAAAPPRRDAQLRAGVSASRRARATAVSDGLAAGIVGKSRDVATVQVVVRLELEVGDRRPRSRCRSSAPSRRHAGRCR